MLMTTLTSRLVSRAAIEKGLERLTLLMPAVIRDEGFTQNQGVDSMRPPQNPDRPKGELVAFHSVATIHQHEVLRFDVTMGDLFGVKILKSLEELLHDKGCHLLVQMLLLQDVVEELAALAVP